MTDATPARGDAKQATMIAPARMIALGSAALMEGFALIGFETHVDPKPEEIDGLMRDLLRTQQSALVVIEQSLAANPGRHLLRAQNEGGRIVITEIPELHLPDNYHSRVETLVQQALGATALEVKE
jgi:vacuolar-type H+-ATPase subunit F/Vma7